MQQEIFYITNDLERGLGLENVLPEFHIVCIDDSSTIDLIGKNVFSLARYTKDQNPLLRNSNRLLNHPEANKYIREHSDSPNIVVFKIAPNLERSAEKFEFKLLNSSSELNRLFERKLSQYEMLSSEGIRFPQTVMTKMSEITHEQLVAKLGDEYVIQYDNGHTGTGTVFVNSEIQLEKEKELFPNRMARISSKIDGQTWTLNCCATRFGTIYDGLSYQITGVEECTSIKGATVGNDWAKKSSLTEAAIDKIEEMGKQVGKVMFKSGFKGLFGIDVIVKDNDVYMIEVNARQPASTSMHTKMMLKRGKIPLMMFQLAEFLYDDESDYLKFLALSVEYEVTVEKVKSQSNLHAEKYIYSQIIIRNSTDGEITLQGDMKNGVYVYGGDSHLNKMKMGVKLDYPVYRIDEEGDKTLVWEQDGYSIEDLNDAKGFLIVTATKGRKVSPETEISRIQADFDILDDDYKVKPFIIESIKGIKKHII